jgi:putative membrane protein
VDDDDDVDPRFTLANERTFLAWNRTALALVSAGAGAAAFLDDLHGARLFVAVPLVLLGAIVALLSYKRWVDTERAMDEGTSMPPTQLPAALAFAVAFLALVLAVLAIVKLA